MKQFFPSRIFLVGFIASGKTTLGKNLSSHLNYKFIDTDEEIEKKENMVLSELIRKKGERYFRKIEWEFIKKLKEEEKVVVALSSGAGASESIMDFIKKEGVVIYLNLKWDSIVKRIEGKKQLLPNNLKIEDLFKIYILRNKIYQKAHIVVNFYGYEDLFEIVKRIERLIKEIYL
jgi:shikimate kinase